MPSTGGIGGEQAGSQPSISSDRSASVVDDLATGAFTATRVDDEMEDCDVSGVTASSGGSADPFKKSGVVVRTPLERRKLR